MSKSIIFLLIITGMATGGNVALAVINSLNSRWGLLAVNIPCAVVCAGCFLVQQRIAVRRALIERSEAGQR